MKESKLDENWLTNTKSHKFATERQIESTLVAALISESEMGAVQ
jgi:hypothetical protein